MVTMHSGEVGDFITLEGIEGSGKTLQLSLLKKELAARGAKFVTTREPGGTHFGQELRQILLHRDGSGREPLAELLLYLADRFQHFKEVIEPAVSSGLHVICDRYHDATLAYQGHARGLGFEIVDQLSTILELPMPVLTLILDVDVEIGLHRACQRNLEEEKESLGRFEAEDLSFHQRVREGYQLLARREPNRVILVDGSGAAEEVFPRILEILDERGLCR